MNDIERPCGAIERFVIVNMALGCFLVIDTLSDTFDFAWIGTLAMSLPNITVLSQAVSSAHPDL
jgi:hypothetical protein